MTRAILVFVCAVALLAATAHALTDVANGVTFSVNYASQPSDPIYQFQFTWGTNSNGIATLGTCQYTYATSPGTSMVAESTLKNSCGFSISNGPGTISISAPVRFYEKTAQTKNLLYSITLFISHTLSTQGTLNMNILAMTPSNITLTGPNIPSHLSLCGETTIALNDPRLQFYTGSSLCIRQTVDTPFSSLLKVVGTQASLQGTDLTVYISDVQDHLREFAANYTEYWILFPSACAGPCIYTSVLTLDMINAPAPQEVSNFHSFEVQPSQHTNRRLLSSADTSTDNSTQAHSVAAISLQVLQIPAQTNASGSLDPWPIVGPLFGVLVVLLIVIVLASRKPKSSPSSKYRTTTTKSSSRKNKKLDQEEDGLLE